MYTNLTLCRQIRSCRPFAVLFARACKPESLGAAFCVLALVVLLVEASCVKAAAGSVASARHKEVGQEQAEAAIREVDFSGFLPSLTNVAESPLQDPYVIEMPGIKQATLTQAEHRLVKTFVLNGLKYSGASTVGNALQFANIRGRLPEDGVEINFLALERDQRNYWYWADEEHKLVSLLSGINLITGKCYGTYASEKFTPGGIWLRKVDTASFLQEHPVKGPPDRPGAEPVVWRVLVWGESPDTVLAEYDDVTFPEVIPVKYNGNEYLYSELGAL